jgi:hypothetical protein
MQKFIITSILILSFSKPAQGVVPLSYQGELHLFGVIGQSQFVGVAPVPAIHPESDTVFIFRNNYKWGYGAEPVDLNSGQVDLVSKDSYANMTPAIPFAVRLEELGREGVGLIPCAKDGSSIDQWQKANEETTLYGSCWKRMLAAQTMGDLDGIIFFQGEYDAHTVALAEAWPAKFVQFVMDIRDDLHNPDLPIVFAQMGTNGAPNSYIGWEALKVGQAAIDIPNVSMITTDDLSRYDVVHLSAAGSITAGRRFAEAMNALLP